MIHGKGRFYGDSIIIGNWYEGILRWKFNFFVTHNPRLNAYIPVIPLPNINACISDAPSYVLTVSKFTICLIT